MPKSPEPKNFEQALSRLESIIAQMESDELPLDDLLVRYEEGIKLVGFCSEKLKVAEKRIQLITEKAGEKPTLQEFDPAPQKAAEPAAAPSTATMEITAEESDEIRLF